MIVKAFIDTNVLIYSISADDAVKKADAISLIRDRKGLHISSQVIFEFIHSSVRKTKIERAKAIGCARGFLSSFKLIVPNQRIVENSMRIMERYGLSCWDSQVIAAALEAGCEILYTEDLQHGQIFEKTLKVVNPFLSRKSS